MITIHKATLDDGADIFALMKQFGSENIPGTTRIPDEEVRFATFRKILENEELGSILVAREDGEPLGVITLSYPVAIHCGGIYSCIEELIVSEKSRGKGVGGKLLEAALAEADARGCYEIQVNRPSELGYPVYLRHGWHDLGKHLLLRLPRQEKPVKE